MIGTTHRAHLCEALSTLKAPSDGAVAYVTCLTGEQVDVLADAEDFAVPGWSLAAVVDTPGRRGSPPTRRWNSGRTRATRLCCSLIASAPVRDLTAFTAPDARFAR